MRRIIITQATKRDALVVKFSLYIVLLFSMKPQPGILLLCFKPVS